MHIIFWQFNAFTLTYTFMVVCFYWHIEHFKRDWLVILFYFTGMHLSEFDSFGHILLSFVY